MTWLAFTALGICISLLIRAALRAVIDRMTEDGRWSDDWRGGLIVVSGASPAEQDIDLPTGEPQSMAPGSTTNGAPNTGRGSIGLNVGG